MLRTLKENGKVIAVAMVTAAVTASAPAVAHGVNHALFAHNADKVDGKHAVGAGASLAQAGGKLVATKGSGKLAGKFIPKVNDANRLDGVDITDVLPGGVLPEGATLRGDYWMGGTAAAGFGLGLSEIDFGYSLASAPTSHFITAGATPPAECPGTFTTPEADPGHLCVYESDDLNAGLRNVSTRPGGDGTAGPYGAGLFVRSAAAGDFWSWGRWAATSGGPTPGPRRQASTIAGESR